MNKTIKISILNDEYKVLVVWGDGKYIEKIAIAWNYPPKQVFLEDHRRGACFYRRDCHPIIVLRKRPKTPQEIATLAHEALHAVYDILFNKIEEKSQSEEVVAHSIAAILRKVL